MVRKRIEKRFFLKITVYVTSYATFRQDSELIKNGFDFLFLDEAQVMKNVLNQDCSRILRQFVVPAVLLCQVRPLKTI